MTVVVLHSTEGSSLEGAIATLVANNSRSHEVWDVKDREMVNLVPLDQPARSLRNEPGGVQTNNRGGVIQIEIVSYASRYSAGDREPVVPEFTDDDLRWLGSQLRELCARVGAPFRFPCTFLPYPQSYGRNGVRLTNAGWLKVEGVIGHQHVPENSHGDPGALDVARLIALSEPAPIEPMRPPFPTEPAISEETEMPHLLCFDGGTAWIIHRDWEWRKAVSDLGDIATLKAAGYVDLELVPFSLIEQLPVKA